MKDGIFKGWDEGTSDRWNDGSVNRKTEGEFVSSEDRNNKGTDSLKYGLLYSTIDGI